MCRLHHGDAAGSGVRDRSLRAGYKYTSTLWHGYPVVPMDQLLSRIRFHPSLHLPRQSATAGAPALH